MQKLHFIFHLNLSSFTTGNSLMLLSDRLKSPLLSKTFFLCRYSQNMTIELPFNFLYNKLNGLQQEDDVLVTEGRIKPFCTNILYQNSWKAYQLILTTQHGTQVPLNQPRIIHSQTKGNSNSNCGALLFFPLELSSCVLHSVKPRKTEGTEALL